MLKYLVEWWAFSTFATDIVAFDTLKIYGCYQIQMYRLQQENDYILPNKFSLRFYSGE